MGGIKATGRRTCTFALVGVPLAEGRLPTEGQNCLCAVPGSEAIAGRRVLQAAVVRSLIAVTPTIDAHPTLRRRGAVNPNTIMGSV